MSENTIQSIENYVLACNTWDDAAILSGVDPTTLHRWRELGEKAYEKVQKTGTEPEDGTAEHDYYRFYKRLRVASLQLKAVLVGRVMDATRVDKKFAIEVLERRWPEEWRKRAQVDTPASPLVDSPRDKLVAKMTRIADNVAKSGAVLAELISKGILDPNKVGGDDGDETDGDGEDDERD